jgi:hypothetical protein
MILYAVKSDAPHSCVHMVSMCFYEVNVQCALGETGSTRISEHCSCRLARCKQEEEESSQHRRQSQHKLPSPYEPPTSATSIIDRRTSNEGPGDTKDGYDRVVAVCLAHA